MYRDVIILLIVLAVGFLTGWKTQGWRLGNEIATIQAKHTDELAKIEKAARDTETKYREQEQRLVASAAQAQEKRNVEVAGINRKLNAALGELRNRPERIVTIPTSIEVPGAPTACAGTTGSELARGDAEFLAGYAADAAKLEAELNKCEAAYNALRN
jgi:hypothetical protein